jgi:transposase
MPYRKIELTEPQRKALVKKAFPKKAVKGILSKVAEESGVSTVTLKDWKKKYFPKGIV